MQCVIKNAIKFKIKAQLQSECLTYYLITCQKYKCVAYPQEDFLFKIGTSRQLKTKSMLSILIKIIVLSNRSDCLLQTRPKIIIKISEHQIRTRIFPKKNQIFVYKSFTARIRLVSLKNDSTQVNVKNLNL
jgi:hypothetical protein